MIPSPTRVACSYLKHAGGGSEFYKYVEGTNARNAFREAQTDASSDLEADWADESEENGEYDGDYSGTIAAKDGFVMRGGPMNREDADAFAVKDFDNNNARDPAFCISVIKHGHPVGFLFYGVAPY